MTAEMGQQRTPAVPSVTDESAGTICAADLKCRLEVQVYQERRVPKASFHWYARLIKTSELATARGEGAS